MALRSWVKSLLCATLCLCLTAYADEKKKEDKKVDQKDHKDHADKAAVKLPDAVAKAWAAGYKEAKVLKIEAKKDSFEIAAQDKWNEKFEVVYGTDGKLWEESKRKLPLANVPAPVVETAKKWAPGAKWSDVAEVETEKGHKGVYRIRGDVGGKNVSAWINDDGSVAKADKLPEAKEVKKAEPKKEEHKKEEPKKEVKKEEKHEHKHDEKKEVKKEEPAKEMK